MSGNGNQMPLTLNQRGSVSYPRVPTPHRPVECYHTAPATGVAYMPNPTVGAQTSVQATIRVQPSQTSASPAPQDLCKTSMADHSYVTPNQTAAQQQRSPQYPNFQYKGTQHNSRPSTHTRQQQQPFIPSAGASTAPVMYPVVFQPPPLGMQTYQQPRSSAPYYQYLGYISGYNTPPGPTPQYYFQSNSPQLPTQNPQTNPNGRSNPTTIVGPQQGTTTTPTAPSVSIPHQQPPTHMQQRIRGTQYTFPRRSHRLAVIDPITRQDVISELFSNETSVNNENSDRQTPQLDQQKNSIVEEFNRRVNEVANQNSDGSASKWNYVTKSTDIPIAPLSNTIKMQPNAINSNNNNNKSEIVTINESKILGPDIAVETNETPIVSAISDSPVIVPKMQQNVKQFQKNSDQSLVIESNKSYSHNKQLKNKNVPQNDKLECSFEDIVIASAAVESTPEKPPVPVPLLSLASTSLVPDPQVHLFDRLPAPHTQRIRESREKSDRREENNKNKDTTKENETTPTNNMNGPISSIAISSIDSLSNAINSPTSQNQSTNAELTNLISKKKFVSTLETIAINYPKVEAIKKEPRKSELTPTELLSASIEKVVKENQLFEYIPETSEISSASEAQAKLTLSLSSVLRSNQSGFMMKDINLNIRRTVPDTANGNSDLTKTDNPKNDINRHDKMQNEVLLNSNKTIFKKSNNQVDETLIDSYENGNETDKVVVEQIKSPQDNTQTKHLQDNTQSKSSQDESQTKSEKPKEEPITPMKFMTKYKYSEGHWSPLNKSGKKSYAVGLLKQIKDDPESKIKPASSPKLETCNVLRTVPIQESLHISNISRPVNDSLFPTFAKGSGMGSRNNSPREPKKDGRNMSTTGRGSMKMTIPGGTSAHKPVIHVRLHDDVKLNEVDSAWKPTRFRQENVSEEELKTQELYKKFRGILNKLTPQKFDTLLDRIKTLDINNQKRLEGVIDLVFEKAIDEPNFSEAYAAMCNKLSTLKVPADNALNPDQCVNFRALIINKCQNQFETAKVDEHVIKLEKDVAECNDPIKKKELLLMLEEEQRKVRMRSVGNVRFIGELYKLKMLTSKIMDYCMKNLIDKLEEEKLECLCKLLTTIGQQIENEGSGQLDNIIKKMQEIVDKKSNKISSRVRFMIQDVIALRKRNWVVKTVIDSQPKMMDQIQKEAEQQQRHIELMNSTPSGGGGGFRRDDGGRKRGDSRRQNLNVYSDNNTQWKPSRTAVDTGKLKAFTQKSLLSNIKLAPHQSAWNHGSGTKTVLQPAGFSNSMISDKNIFSLLDTSPADPTSIRGARDITQSYHAKGASIERSTFNTARPEFSTESNRSGSVTVPRSISDGQNAVNSVTNTTSNIEDDSVPAEVVPPEPLTDDKNCVQDLIKKFMKHHDIKEFILDIKNAFPPKYHVDVIKKIFKITVDKSPKEFELIAKSFEDLISQKIFSAANFLAGMKETLELSPDLYIDIPLLYENLGRVVAPHIAKKDITIGDIHKNSENIIAANQGQLLLKAIFRNMRDSMSSSFLKTKWQESGMELKQWMEEDQVTKWMGDNNLEFIEESSKLETKLLHLMKTDESYDDIKAWIQNKIGKSINEDWFMRALSQAICENALASSEEQDTPHFNQDRMMKYANLIQEFGDNKKAKEYSCLIGIQQLIHRREHPQGLALVIFQHLHENYIISIDGFIEWEKSEKEPEGKAVMLKMLTSFFSSLKDGDNEDTCSED